MDFDKLKADFEFRLKRYDEGNCDWKYLPEYLIQAVKEEYLSIPIEPSVKPESGGQWVGNGELVRKNVSHNETILYIDYLDDQVIIAVPQDFDDFVKVGDKLEVTIRSNN